MAPLVLRDRRDLVKIAAWSEIDLDSSGHPIVWENHYHHDETGESWTDRWSCHCDDKCPCCGNAYSPVYSDWIGPDELLMRALWESLPESGGRRRAISVLQESDGTIKLDYNWMLTGTEEAPRVIAVGPWPGLDAYIRKLRPDIHPDAVVYSAGSAGEKDMKFSMAAAVLIDNRISIEMPIERVKASKIPFSAFIDSFEAPRRLANTPSIQNSLEPL